MRSIMREELEAYFLEETEEEEEIVETSTMAGGSVEGSAGGLGKEADIYDVWNQKSLEETNMNKFKITKGRLRRIIFEEVQRAKRLDEAWSPDAEKAEAEEIAAQTTTAAPYVATMGEADENDGNANSKEDAIRELAASATAGKVEGADVDPRSAAAIVKVLDSLDDDNKTRFLKLDVSQMAEMAMRLMKEGSISVDERRRAELGEATQADKDYDGDGEVESSEEEWKGSRDKAIKKAVTETLEGILSEEPVEEGAEERVAKFNKGPSTEERREKLKKIAAANKAKKEKDKK